MDFRTWAETHQAVVPEVGMWVVAGIALAVVAVGVLLAKVDKGAEDSRWLPPTWVFWSRSLERRR